MIQHRNFPSAPNSILLLASEFVATRSGSMMGVEVSVSLGRRERWTTPRLSCRGDGEG
ncbi:hypothetical protein DAI22_05g062700 [Oryza sativa Japonica Group]|nr:hypothetical protein DAI22_05g062700 [Oryza sativa Japonica Group]